jgi:predicted metal-dependent hydrolase
MKRLTVDGLTFQVRESTRRETLEIIVDRDGSLMLATPPGVPQAVLEQFVADRLVWVYTRLEEKAAQAQPRGQKAYVTGEGFYYLGRSHRLKLVDGASQRVPLRLYQGRFWLRRDARPYAREHFVGWYTLHLRPLLDRLLPQFTDRVGATPREVHIQDLGFRWGSSGKRGHVYFHWRVAMLPYRMMAYVVAHELVHLVEKDHDQGFWQRLGRLIPDYEERRRWLREEGTRYDL